MSGEEGPPRAGRPRSALAWLEAPLLAGVLAGALGSLVLVLANGLAPTQRPLTFGLALWLWTSAFYGAAALALALLAAALARLARRSGASRLLWAGAALAFLGLVGRALPRVFPPSAAFAASPRFAALALPAVALTALALGAAALVSPRRMWLARALGLAAAALTAAALWPAAPPTSGATADGAGTARAAASGPRLPAPPLLVFGVDGGDWDYIEPLLARGELPAFAALRARGAWGVLATQRPTLSPVVWTTIATGRSPENHGIRGFVTESLRGVDAPLPALDPAGVPGAARLFELLRHARVVSHGPIRSDVRRVPAFWNLATREGSPVSVVDWWATWPAERVLGSVVSERVYYRPEPGLRGTRLTWPEGLAAELARLVKRRDQVSYDDARRFLDLTPAEFEGLKARPARERTLEAQLTYFCAMTETDRRVALHLVEDGRRRYGRPPDLLVLFRLVDMVGHTSLRFSELVDDHLGATPEELRRYGRVVSEAHRAVDRALGELLAAFGAGANVVVVSDHGFELQAHAPDWRPSYDHRNGAPGMFLAAGPAFRAGRVDGLAILDVFPLLAELKGFPLADDLEGRPARDALGTLFVAGEPPRRVASYGPRDAGLSAAGGAADDEELLERLRALGYLR